MPARVADIASIEGVVQKKPIEGVAEAKEDAQEEGSANNHPADLETADASDITNLYSYCVEESLDGDSGAKATVCLLLLCVLTFVQVIYAYGYCDASVLLKSLNALPAYMDSMDKSLFYSNSVIKGTSLPLLQCLASVCSIVLLALVMKKDNESTMLTTSPLGHWILGDAAPARAGAASRWTRLTRNFAQRNKIATSTTVIFSSSSAQDDSAREKPSQLSPAAAITDEMKAERTRLKDLFDSGLLPEHLYEAKLKMMLGLPFTSPAATASGSQPLPPRPSRSQVSRLVGALRRLGWFSLCFSLTILQLLRSLMLPVYAGIGAAGNFAAAVDTQEIILNSVAIGFGAYRHDWRPGHGPRYKPCRTPSKPCPTPYAPCCTHTSYTPYTPCRTAPGHNSCRMARRSLLRMCSPLPQGHPPTYPPTPTSPVRHPAQSSSWTTSCTRPFSAGRGVTSSSPPSRARPRPSRPSTRRANS